jgi:hypothetical protein
MSENKTRQLLKQRHGKAVPTDDFGIFSFVFGSQNVTPSDPRTLITVEEGISLAPALKAPPQMTRFISSIRMTGWWGFSAPSLAYRSSPLSPINDAKLMTLPAPDASQ